MTAKTLTPSAVELAEAREMLRWYKGRVQFLAAQVKEQRLDAKIAKAEAARARREAAIEKATARLARLMEKESKPVGVKALRANRRPSKGVVLQASV